MNHEGRSPDNAQEEQEWLSSLSLCVGSLHSFLKCLRSFELRLGFTVPNLEHIIRDDWRRLPEGDLRPLLHRILNAAILRETALPEIRKAPNNR